MSFIHADFDIKENWECKICGRPATGIHFGVVACGGCKAFYKRGVRKKILFFCFDGNCPTQANVESRCKACRFRKCVEAGMTFKTRIRRKNRKGPQEVPVAKMDPIQLERQICKNGRDALVTNQSSLIVWSSTTSYATAHASKDNEGEPGSIAQLIEEDPEVYVYLPDGTRLSSKMGPYARQIPYIGHVVGDQNVSRQHKIICTVYAVQEAVRAVFGSQLAAWTVCKNRALKDGYVVSQPETTLSEMVAAINSHNRDNIIRTQQFAVMLPGILQLEPAARACTKTGWKFLVYNMLHHAEFLTDVETYITVGSQQFHYCRYWQERIGKKSFLDHSYKICSVFRDIKLEQTERYILMAVVMFEPGTDKFSCQSQQLQVTHRHYTDVLIDVLKRRCSDPIQLATICGKLERFFSFLKLVYGIYRSNFETTDEECPPSAVEAKAAIRRLQSAH